MNDIQKKNTEEENQALKRIKEKHTSSENDDGFFSHEARMLIGFFATIGTFIFFLYSMNEAFSIKSLVLLFFFFAIMGACFSHGKLSRVFGSIVCSYVCIASLSYFVIRGLEIYQKFEPFYSIYEPIMFGFFFGLPSAIFIWNTKFGLVEPKTDNEKYGMNWYKVTFDDDHIYREVTPPAYRDWRKGFRKVQTAPWNDRIKWSEIDQICFMPTDLFASDEILIHTTGDEHYRGIPTEADGGIELWEAILDRGIFDEELAIMAMGEVRGMFCTPSMEEMAK